MDKFDLIDLAIKKYPTKDVIVDDIQKEISDLIKGDQKRLIKFKGHSDFEEFINQARSQILKVKEDNAGKFIVGNLYIYLLGKTCWERIKEDLILLDAATNMFFVFGDKVKLEELGIKFNDGLLIFPENIKSKEYTFKSKEIYSKMPDKRTDNHQRFFIYDSSSVSLGLISRKRDDGVTEFISTNDRKIVKYIVDKLD